VPLEERVEQQADGGGAVARGDEIPSPEREDLLRSVIEPIGRSALRGESALASLIPTLVAVAGLLRPPALDDGAALNARHLSCSSQPKGPGPGD
jgi:hypothetical protein